MAVPYNPASGRWTFVSDRTPTAFSSEHQKSPIVTNFIIFSIEGKSILRGLKHKSMITGPTTKSITIFMLFNLTKIVTVIIDRIITIAIMV